MKPLITLCMLFQFIWAPLALAKGNSQSTPLCAPTDWVPPLSDAQVKYCGGATTLTDDNKYIAKSAAVANSDIYVAAKAAQKVEIMCAIVGRARNCSNSLGDADWIKNISAAETEAGICPTGDCRGPAAPASPQATTLQGESREIKVVVVHDPPPKPAPAPAPADDDPPPRRSGFGDFFSNPGVDIGIGALGGLLLSRMLFNSGGQQGGYPPAFTWGQRPLGVWQPGALGGIQGGPYSGFGGPFGSPIGGGGAGLPSFVTNGYGGLTQVGGGSLTGYTGGYGLGYNNGFSNIYQTGTGFTGATGITGTTFPAQYPVQPPAFAPIVTH